MILVLTLRTLILAMQVNSMQTSRGNFWIVVLTFVCDPAKPAIEKPVALAHRKT